jgi:hypothetical protein
VSHCKRSDAKEMRAVVPFRMRLIDELEVSLVDEGGGVQCCAIAATGKMTVRDLAKLLIEQRYELVDLLAAADWKVFTEVRGIRQRHALLDIQNVGCDAGLSFSLTAAHREVAGINMGMRTVKRNTALRGSFKTDDGGVYAAKKTVTAFRVDRHDDRLRP